MGEPDERENRGGLRAEARFLDGEAPASREHFEEPGGAAQVHTGQHVVLDAQRGKHAGSLKRANDTAPRDRRGSQPAQRCAVVGDAAAGWTEVAGDRIERSRLAGAVGPDHAGDRARAHVERHRLERGHAAAAHGEISNRESQDAPRLRSACNAGTIPRGRKNTSSTSSTPYASICHCHDAAARRVSGSTVKSTAPTSGPASVPLPPATTMMTIVTV